MTTITGTGTATINLKLRVNAQPVINLRKLLKLKHNSNQMISISTTQKVEVKDFNT